METSIANQNPIKVLSRTSECMRRLMEAGLPFDALQMPIDDPEMRERLVRFWLVGGYKPSISQERAREVMGKDFLGVEEALQHFFGVKFSRQELAGLSEVPYPAEVLEVCKGEYILVAMPSMSIMDMRAKHRDLLWETGKEVRPYWANYFTRKIDKARWHLVRKTPVDNSAGKIWEKQVALLGKDEEALSARVGIYTMMGYFLATGERLFSDTPLRCPETTEENVYNRRSWGHVEISHAEGREIVVNTPGYDSSGPGIGASRKAKTLPKWADEP